jgi:TRAP-type mannitol/chloroaromatic compound transport system permease small subunit
MVLRWFVFGMVVILCYEVILRGIFDNPTLWAHESSQYVFGFYFALGGGFALWYGGMVRVDILIKRFRPRTRAIIESVTAIVTLVFLLAMVGKGAELAVHSVAINETSFTPWGPPIWPLKIIVVVGAFLLLIQVLANLTRDIILGATGKEPS